MRRSSALLAVLLFATALVRVSAEDFQPLPLIGMQLKEAVAAIGLPDEMFSFRGTEESLDNVVFYYADHRYLFWYKGRVWQVRCDRRFTGTLFGLSLGMTRDQVEKISSWVLIPNGDSLYFDLGDRGFPVRVRLVFTANLLNDIYVYRSDF
jgi:hypothetical protein